MVSKLFTMINYNMLTCILTRDCRNFYRTCLRSINTASYILQRKVDITPRSIGIQQLICSRHSSHFCRGNNMSSQIKIVCYEYIKSLPNHSVVLLIDVREPDEIQQTGKIPTSINIPLSRVQSELGRGTKGNEFRNKYSRYKPCTNTEIVFYCRSGKRAQVAAETAVELGYTNVKNYKGSWNDWSKREGLQQ